MPVNYSKWWGWASCWLERLHTCSNSIYLEITSPNIFLYFNNQNKKWDDINDYIEENMTFSLFWINSEQILNKFEQILNKFWPNSEQILTKFLPNSDQILNKFWKNSKQILTKLWTNSDQILTTSCPNSDQILTKFWPNSDQILNKFWLNSDKFWPNS